MAVEPSFNFYSYLLCLTGQNWSVQELSGGNANHTVRVTRHLPANKKDGTSHNDLDGPGFLDGVTSMVVKQAPPYFVRFPDMKFSEYRQTIEAKALSLFHASPDSELSLSNVLSRHPDIKIPRLLRHDLQTHVLIQSDLGTHLALNDFLGSPDTTPTLASDAGKSLGNFLKELHCSFDSCSEKSKESLRNTFRNDEGETVMCGVISNVIEFMKNAGINDYEVLGTRALTNWQGRNKTVFGQGDIWFGTLLVGIEEGRVRVGICDWEFAGYNHPAGDVGQLGSYLHLMSIASLSTQSTKANLRSFSDSLYKSFLSSNGSAPIHDREFKRTLLIMHSWELVNAAAWRHYLWCTCPGEGVKCQHVVDMILVGAQMLRAAGEEGAEVDWDALREHDWCTFLKGE